MQKLGLVMIVRDEADMLKKTLPAVAELVTAAVVMDTGSKDDTMGVVDAEFAGTGVKLTGERIPWRGFADARTRAMELTRAHPAPPDYWLFLDADMLVETTGPLPDLTESAYFVKLPGAFQMWLPLVLKHGLNWGYEGGAHSGLVYPAGATTGRLAELTVTEQRKNSPRADYKFDEDLANLEAQLDPRTVHYFAQTLKDLGHAREAADAYRFRVRLSAANPEEVFWSCYQEGILRHELDGLAAATPVLLEAYERRPTRAESLQYLAREYRLAGKPHVAVMFAEIAAGIDMPDDMGFVLAWVYEWGAKMELALAERATGDKGAAILSFEWLLATGTASAEATVFAEQQLAELRASSGPAGTLDG